MGAGVAGVRRCPVCGKPHGGRSAAECEGCKAEKRRLARLHLEFRRGECEADAAEKAARVELYARVVAGGGRLFCEGGGEDLP